MRSRPRFRRRPRKRQVPQAGVRYLDTKLKIRLRRVALNRFPGRIRSARSADDAPRRRHCPKIKISSSYSVASLSLEPARSISPDRSINSVSNVRSRTVPSAFLENNRSRARFDRNCERFIASRYVSHSWDVRHRSTAQSMIERSKIQFSKIARIIVDGHSLERILSLEEISFAPSRLIIRRVKTHQAPLFLLVHHPGEGDKRNPARFA